MKPNPCHRQTPPRGARCRGFTLMEVLIALIVMAIGLLGLAALQAQGLKFNHDAYVRTQATVLAYDILERIRLAGPANAGDYTAADPRPGTACLPNSTNRTVELACWYRGIENTMPGGVVAGTGITFTPDDVAVPTGPGVYTVTIAWTDRQAAAARSQLWTVRIN